jgi:3-oxoacyl-[acyl-carrier protein] reductase
VDRYYAANAGNADYVENKLREMHAEYLILESDISNEKAVKEIYAAAYDRFGRVDILVNNAATDDETMLLLASEQARMITGQVIKVSGGKAL